MGGGLCGEVIDYHLKHLLQISLVGWDDERTPPFPLHQTTRPLRGMNQSLRDYC